MEHKREPRGIAYFSEDPEFRDNIYEKGKDAYIQLGGISYPDIFEEIYDFFRRSDLLFFLFEL